MYLIDSGKEDVRDQQSGEPVALKAVLNNPRSFYLSISFDGASELSELEDMHEKVDLKKSP